MFSPEELANLMKTARAAVRSELMAALPEEHHHTALMVANALSIAERYFMEGPPSSETDIRNLVSRCRSEVAIASPKALMSPRR